MARLLAVLRIYSLDNCFVAQGCVILSCEKIIKTSLSLFLKGKILKRLQNVVPLSGEATLFKTHRGKYTPPSLPSAHERNSIDHCV